MTPDDHRGLIELVQETRTTWLPPAGADPGADWREVTFERFHVWRVAGDARLVSRFAAILERSRLSIERDMLATAPRAPDDAVH